MGTAIFIAWSQSLHCSTVVWSRSVEVPRYTCWTNRESVAGIIHPVFITSNHLLKTKFTRKHLNTWSYISVIRTTYNDKNYLWGKKYLICTLTFFVWSMSHQITWRRRVCVLYCSHPRGGDEDVWLHSWGANMSSIFKYSLWFHYPGAGVILPEVVGATCFNNLNVHHRLG